MGKRKNKKKDVSEQVIIRDLRTVSYYELSTTCKLVIRSGDITKWFVDGTTDAIVNAAHEDLVGGGGVDGAIHRVAGKELLNYCRKLPFVTKDCRCPTGEAVPTPGFNLKVNKIIHATGPIYKKELAEHCAETLKKCYRNALRVARDQGVKYIAFPAISCGIRGYPVQQGAQIAIDTVREEADGFTEIHFVLLYSRKCEPWLAAAERAGLTELPPGDSHDTSVQGEEAAG